MNKKVAINVCFGGFSLSDAAFELLLNLKQIRFEKRSDGYYYDPDSDAFISQYSFYDDCAEQRSDVDLIKVIETLGPAANGSCASLAIVDIPDDVDYTIEEYDGFEHVAEVHRKWYGWV